MPLEEKIGLLIQQNLAEVGIQGQPGEVPWALLTQQATKAETTPNITQRFASAPYPDPDALISQAHSRYMGTTLKMDWYADPEVDRMIEAARQTTDDAKRRELYIAGAAAPARRHAVEPLPARDRHLLRASRTTSSAPLLDDPNNGVAAQGGNWVFRTFSIDK